MCVPREKRERLSERVKKNSHMSVAAASSVMMMMAGGVIIYIYI